MLVAIVMAGGRGERFWPRSRRRLPKQLLSLVGENTMIQETARRIEPLVEPDRVFVVTSEEHAHAVAEQLPRVPPSNILVEPCGRNTAPCIGLAAVHLQKSFGQEDPVMIVLPSDHLIVDECRFIAALTLAVEAAARVNTSLPSASNPRVLKPGMDTSRYQMTPCSSVMVLRIW